MPEYLSRSNQLKEGCFNLIDSDIPSFKIDPKKCPSNNCEFSVGVLIGNGNFENI